MAIDFMVMAMSRYISGDFVTPAMRLAWERGIPYAIIGPQGKRELPPGLPFGGADAPAYRERIVEMVCDDLRSLPRPISSSLWDERSNKQPRFYRVDAGSYQSLLEFLSSRQDVSLFGLRKKPRPSHAAAALVLPCEFETPVELTTPLERTAGSAKRALQELTGKLPTAATSAAATLREAIEACLDVRLPMIVDY
jgi:hypothetical protein